MSCSVNNSLWTDSALLALKNSCKAVLCQEIDLTKFIKFLSDNLFPAHSDKHVLRACFAPWGSSSNAAPMICLESIRIISTL